ncbi:hypothetical protein L1987_05767 [Smallanthus sonchifolius]|uniref:Uncharacterized protein n=1 Tax=Smallanthus sonchifolius TaxID=185202 RepID=A0ACB9JWG0_9ASTR|nr:hypothetical protein L1987_05767 [Smallanthus sonchifolius]
MLWLTLSCFRHIPATVTLFLIHLYFKIYRLSVPYKSLFCQSSSVARILATIARTEKANPQVLYRHWHSTN